MDEVRIPSFTMVKYHKKEYPPEIALQIEEIAAHFDVIANKRDTWLFASYGIQLCEATLFQRIGKEISQHCRCTK